MPLTRRFDRTVEARAERDPAFRIGLLQEAMGASIDDDIETGSLPLRDYAHASVAFDRLATKLNWSPEA